MSVFNKYALLNRDRPTRFDINALLSSFAHSRNLCNPKKKKKMILWEILAKLSHCFLCLAINLPAGNSRPFVPYTHMYGLAAVRFSS